MQMSGHTILLDTLEIAHNGELLRFEVSVSDSLLKMLALKASRNKTNRATDGPLRLQVVGRHSEVSK